MTDTSAFSLAADLLTGIGLATGVALRVLHRCPYPPMAGLIVTAGMLQIVASTLQRDWSGVFWSLTVDTSLLGLLVYDARGGPQ